MTLTFVLQQHFLQPVGRGSYPMVLISSDSNEACLWKGKRNKVSLCIQVAVGCRIDVHHMEAWLVTMHGI